MSRSKRAAQVQTRPEIRQKRNIRVAGVGGIRTGWLLAASLFGYALVALATRFGLVRAFAALFAAWRIDASSVRRAPVWAQALYVWHGSLATAAFAVLTLVGVRWLRRLWRLDGPAVLANVERLWRPALAGMLAMLVIAALCLVPDSMRLEWPLSAPRLTWGLPVMAALSLLSAVAEEAFGKRVLYDGLRGRWNGLWTTAVVCAVFALDGGGFAGSALGAVNALLLGWVGCALYARHGFWISVGFRWGWSLANAFLLGFGGGDWAVYRLYGVSEALLTGGDAGPMHGLWATLTLVAVIATVTRKRK